MTVEDRLNRGAWPSGLTPNDAIAIDLAIDEALAVRDAKIHKLEGDVAKLNAKLAVVERTQYGIQQLLGKAAAYVGKERGKLPQ